MENKSYAITKGLGNPADFEKFLNNLGKEGWKLNETLTQHGHTQGLIFVREKE